MPQNDQVEVVAILDGEVLSTSQDNENLMLLIKSAGEVSREAALCLLFGHTSYQEGHGIGGELLSQVIGELMAITEILPLDRAVIESSRRAVLNGIKMGPR